MRISVEPDALRALSRQLQQSGEQINQIRAVLNQAVDSLLNDAETMEIVMNTWRLANLQSVEMVSALMEMATTLQNKGDQFQIVDEQPFSTFHSSAISNHSPVAMFEMSKKNLQLLSGLGKESTVISNPSSAVAAIVGENMKEDIEVGLGWEGPSATGGNSLGYGSLMIGTMLKSGFTRGTRYTLNNAAQNPQVWKFIDPKIAAREAVSFKGVGGATQDTAFVVVNGGIGLGTMAGSAAIGAAIGSAVPIVGTAVGAAVGLGVGVTVSAVTEIKINGKSLKTHAVAGVDNAIEGVISGEETAVDGMSDTGTEAAEAVAGTVDTVSSGVSRSVTRVKERLGFFSMFMLFS
ncbi:WXG100 family type VII secretion target [Paenibacillus sp. IHBB 10380]|uniref:WXG100 family type VII secretion target n=1 Tax=Paenibacillus sp. IHBB 10380 TaxID=1566358 RepID=UPI0006971843|nr:WXG100 family type VII secretion target [Paenibacillus sp. IHBB 10380]